MPCISDTVTSFDATSGALDVNKNLATTAGYATIAGGVVLSGAVGLAVAPAPTLGLITVGSGLVVAGNIQEIKAHFSGNKPVVEYETPDPELSPKEQLELDEKYFQDAKALETAAAA